MTTRVLTRRELGRATLARQLLLERSPLGPAEAVAQVAGLQAQEPQEPYLGLHARLRRPRPGRREPAAGGAGAGAHLADAPHRAPGDRGRRAGLAAAARGDDAAAGVGRAARAVARGRRGRAAGGRRAAARRRRPARCRTSPARSPAGGPGAAARRRRPARLRRPRGAGAAARAVAAAGPRGVHHVPVLARRGAAAAVRRRARRPGAALPRGVRPGRLGRRPRVVRARRAARRRWPGCARRWSPTATSAVASCWTCRTRPCRTPTCRRRRGSCPPSTTPCSATTTGPA